MMLACLVAFNQRPPREQMPPQKMCPVPLWEGSFPLSDLGMRMLQTFRSLQNSKIRGLLSVSSSP